MRRGAADPSREIGIQIPGKWREAPALRGVSLELRPRDPAVGEEYRQLSGNALSPRHLEALGTHTAVLRASVAGHSAAMARALLRAGAALLASDGVAVKVETSGRVHSAEEWVDLAGRQGVDGVFYAFVAIEGAGDRAASRGMESFGLSDAVLFTGPEEGLGPEAELKPFLYQCLAAGAELREGDLYCAGSSYSPVYRLDRDAGSPTHPQARWRLTAAGPEPLAGLTDASAISAGGHALALRADGSVWTWGTNHASHNGVRYSFDRPQKVRGLWAPAVAISAGDRHSLILLADGSVGAFGHNSYGQLGNGTGDPSEAVVRVDGVAGAIAVSAGSDHSLALLEGGSVMAWGGNQFCQLGDGTRSPRFRPVPVPGIPLRVSAIAAGANLSLALLGDGSVMQCGHRQIDDQAAETLSRFQRVVLGEPATAIAGRSQCLAVLSGGSVAAWGSNFLGQLGDGTRRARGSPDVVPGLPGRAVAVTAGSYNGLVLLDGGGLVTWGYPHRTPTPVAAGDVVAVSAGMNFSLALVRSGAVMAWGSNLSGQLGVARCHVAPGFGAVPSPPQNPRATDALLALARPSVRFHSRPSIDVPVGGTKLGGLPDLPPDIAWPEVEGVPQAFVAQVGVGEVMDALRSVIPENGAGSGLLAFFCDSGFRISDDDYETLPCRVLAIPADAELVRRDFPDTLPPDWRFPELALVPEGEVMDVPVEAWEVDQLRLARDQVGAWADRHGYPEDTRHRMFGYPEPIQNEPRHWSDEVLLLQVDADDGAGMDWGDCRRIFYLIRQDDLVAARFDDVRLVYQCH